MNSKFEHMHDYNRQLRQLRLKVQPQQLTQPAQLQRQPPLLQAQLQQFLSQRKHA